MKKLMLLAMVIGLLSGCVATKQFTYSFDKAYVPLVGESANDPAPYPY
jgi:hypothetical protein